MSDQQWVCKVCGYNMIGKMPDVCPLCGAKHDHFMASDDVEKTYRVTPHRVNDYVTQLLSVPRLGFEHAAYRIETEEGAVWIDCPSAFNRDLEPVQAIYFTHPDFMGASNQYRQLWGAKVHLHTLDADISYARPFPVDRRFDGDFREHGIEAFHIGGHSPGFTIYIYDKVLFICDYAEPSESGIQLNPFGPRDKILDGAARILAVISERCAKGAATRSLETVCGYNFVTEFDSWRKDFKRLLD